jgi:hypothetical protein
MVAGLIIGGLGLALSLDASNIATHWQMIGENAWGGETDPARAQLYQTLGLMAMAFGLFLAGSGFWKWLNSTGDADVQARWHSSVR